MDCLSSTLTPLQQEVLDALRDVPGFYLTGGAALAAKYLGHRQSYDLDLFVVQAEDVEVLGARLRATAAERGWAVEEVQRYPGFVRCIIRNKDAATLVDVVHETTPQVVELDAKPIHGGVRFDAIEDLVANKLCAILGRGEVKDLVDLFFLTEAGVDVIGHLDHARQKDAGLDAATLAYVLRGMAVDTEGLLLVRPVSEEDLKGFRDRLVDRLVHLAWPG